MKNDERFYTRDEQLKRKKDERKEFLRKEEDRHNKNVGKRDVILKNIAMEQDQKKEMNQLRQIDAQATLERERRKKQEFQDFWLKKEFVKNAFNQEASLTASTMIN